METWSVLTEEFASDSLDVCGPAEVVMNSVSLPNLHMKK